MATMTTLHPANNLRVEKQSRWSIKLVVTPMHPPGSVHHLRSSRQDRLDTSMIGSDDATVVQISLGAPQKRKMSSSALADATTTFKRWHRGSRIEEPSDRSPSSKSLRESFSRDVLQCARHNPLADPENRQALQQPAEIRHDSGSSTLPRLLVLSQPVTLDNTAISERESFQQDDIQQNYHEFADCRLFKDAGLVISPVSDGERRAYESIFMGDSDESSPLIEEGSMTWDAAMSDK